MRRVDPVETGALEESTTAESTARREQRKSYASLSLLLSGLLQLSTVGQTQLAVRGQGIPGAATHGALSTAHVGIEQSRKSRDG